MGYMSGCDEASKVYIRCTQALDTRRNDTRTVQDDDPGVAHLGVLHDF